MSTFSSTIFFNQKELNNTKQIKQFICKILKIKKCLDLFLRIGIFWKFCVDLFVANLPEICKILSMQKFITLKVPYKQCSDAEPTDHPKIVLIKITANDV